MKTVLSLVAAASLLSGHVAAAAARPPRAQRENRPDIPEVARPDAICFSYYTVNHGVLKLTAQLYPLKDGESREARLQVKDGDGWRALATTRVTEEPYNNYRQDKTWTAHFRVENWDESRTVAYRVTALDGVAAYEGSIRANPSGKREIVVAAFTGNSNQDRLDLREKTLADAFKAAGHATGCFGKWHNGSQWPYHPMARGFDEYFGHTSGHWGEYFDAPLEETGRMIRTKGYIVDVCTDRALACIEKNHAKSFLCYVPFTTPHSPWAACWRNCASMASRRLPSSSTSPTTVPTRCAGPAA